MNKVDKIGKLEHIANIAQLKNKLYEIHNINKYDNFTNIYNEIKKHDKELANTLMYITSDFNTQLSLQQNHFINVLDQLLINEEKKLLKEINDHEEAIGETLAENQKNNKPPRGLSDNATKILTEYKMLVFVITLFLLAAINTEIFSIVTKSVKHFFIPGS